MNQQIPGHGDYKFKSGKMGAHRMRKGGFQVDFVNGSYWIRPGDIPENYPHDDVFNTPLSIADIWRNGYMFFVNGYEPLVAEYHDKIREFLGLTISASDSLE